jgi:hypothetical protein
VKIFLILNPAALFATTVAAIQEITLREFVFDVRGVYTCLGLTYLNCDAIYLVLDTI